MADQRPGYGKANPKSQASIEYNKNICMQTTRWAIVEWLKDEHQNGIWKASHFSYGAVVIVLSDNHRLPSLSTL